jgi:hypothetical protein
VVGADHEVRGDRWAVRACPQVGDVALEPGQGLGIIAPTPWTMPWAVCMLPDQGR